MKKNIVILSAIVLAAAGSAFTLTKKEPAKQKVMTTWYFDGTSSQIKQAAHWRSSGSENADCSTSGTRPCAITVDAADQEDLQEYLNPLTAGAITASSTKKRP